MTPHPTTGMSPAELLFTRKFRTKLPDVRKNAEREDIRQAREQDRKEKARKKMYKDNKYYVWPHNIKEGDTILLERKVTKMNSPYDPQLYKAKTVHGMQIIGRRGEEGQGQPKMEESRDQAGAEVQTDHPGDRR